MRIPNGLTRVCATLAIILATGCLKQPPPPSSPEPGETSPPAPPAPPAGGLSLVDAILEAIEVARPQEFPSPESAARYFLQQVRAQDGKAVTRVLPIIEVYRHRTFEQELSHLRSLDAQGIVHARPEHNLLTTLTNLLGLYDRLSMGLLTPGSDFPSIYVLVDEDNLPGEIDRLKRELAPSRLARLEFRVALAPDQYPPQTELLEMSGASDERRINFTASHAGYTFTGRMIVRKFGDNWKVCEVWLDSPSGEKK